MPHLLPPPWPGLMEIEAECVSRARVEQRIDVTDAAPTRFVEELLRVPLPHEEGGLALLRKVLPPDALEAVGGLRGAVLLVHGFAQNHRTWHLNGRSLPNYLAARGYDTYCLDLRGQGLSRARFGSPMPDHPDDYIYGDMPAAVSAVLARTPCPQVTLVGHSMGGAICYACAPFLAEAGALSGVVTFAAIFGMARDGDFMHQLCRLGSIAHRLGVPGDVSVPLPWIARRLLMPLSKLLDHRAAWLLPFHGWYPGTISPELLDQQLGAGMDQVTVGVTLTLARWGVEGYFYDRMRGDYVEHFRQLRDVPVLVLAADDDLLVTPEDARQAVAWAASEDVTFRCFGADDGGHGWGHLDIILGDDAPRLVWPEVGAWLDARCPDARYAPGPELSASVEDPRPITPQLRPAAERARRLTRRTTAQPGTTT